MPPEITSLERYFSTGDEAAFAAVVKAYLPLVFSAASRITNNRSLSEEVAQTVFCRLAGLKRGLPAGLLPATWLHRITRTTALNVVRSESRRQRREEIAVSLAAMNETRFPWERISPILDEVIGKLTPEDRELVLSRFFVGESSEEMARRLGVGHEAVKKRLQRALGRLRDHLGRSGIQTTTAALALSLPAYGVETVGLGLHAAIASAAVSTPIAPAAFTTFTALLMKKSLTVSVLAILATGSIWLVSQARSSAALEEKIASLRGRIAAAGAGATTVAPHRGGISSTAAIDWRSFLEMRESSGDQIALKRMTAGIDRHLDELPADGLSRELDRLGGLHLKEEDQLEIETLLLWHLSEKDPALAMHHLEDQLSDDRLSYPAFLAYRKWVGADPRAALAWLDTQIAAGKLEATTLEEANPTRKWLEASLLPHLLAHDPEAAKARLLNLPPAQRGPVFGVAEVPPGLKDAAAEVLRATLPPESH